MAREKMTEKELIKEISWAIKKGMVHGFSLDQSLFRYDLKKTDYLRLKHKKKIKKALINGKSQFVSFWQFKAHKEIDKPMNHKGAQLMLEMFKIASQIGQEGETRTVPRITFSVVQEAENNEQQL